MVLHRPSDQWRGVVGVFGWGWSRMNAFLVGATVVCAVQCVCLAIITLFGDRLKYETHQAICLLGALLWFPGIALCIASVVTP